MVRDRAFGEKTCKSVVEIVVVIWSKLVEQELVDVLSQDIQLKLLAVWSKDLHQLPVLSIKLLSQVTLLVIVVLEGFEGVVDYLQEDFFDLLLADLVAEDGLNVFTQLDQEHFLGQEVIVNDEFEQFSVVTVHCLSLLG